MNIKVKLPFLFTFLQLGGATCSGRPALALLTEQRRSDPTGSGHLNESGSVQRRLNPLETPKD